MNFFAGPVERVALPRDKETDKVKGFAFVTYKYLCSIDYAMNIFVGTKLFNRDVHIKYRNANKNREQQQKLQLQMNTLQQMQLSHTPNSLLGANIITNPLVMAICDIMPMQSQAKVQNKLISMANGYAQPTTFIRQDDYPSMRTDHSGSQRDHFVDRRRHHREDENRSRSKPYRRSRSRSKERDRDLRGGRNERRHERPSSSGNYHRWGNR
jgi:RNA recognition motif-containing protein